MFIVECDICYRVESEIRTAAKLMAKTKENVFFGVVTVEDISQLQSSF